MNWSSDPDLKALRDGFVDSFSERRKTLRAAIDRLSSWSGPDVESGDSVALEIRVVAHNLAGSAASYGFDKLGAVATVLDDYLSLELRAISAERLSRFARLLMDSLEQAGRARADLASIDSGIFKELTSCVESLASAAKS